MAPGSNLAADGIARRDSPFTESDTDMNRLATLLAATLTLSACGSNQDIVRDCCYQGSVSAAHLDTLAFTLEDGTTVPVTTALAGLERRPGFGGARYPVRELALNFVVESDLSEIFSSYDANRSTHLEQPEITVLYLREAARGLGVPVAQVGIGAPIGAIDTSAADIMGLVHFVDRNRQRMNERGRKVFAEMDSQRDWKRTQESRGSDGPLQVF